MFKKIFILVFILLMIIPVSFALEDNQTINNDNLGEIHVDVNGSDDNEGDSHHPLLTITKAINISQNNSKIIIHEGEYKENNLNITKSLEIHGQGNVIINALNKNRIITINTQKSDNVVLTNLTFINGKSQQMAGAIYVLGAKTTIDNCKFISNTAASEGGAIFWNSLNGNLVNSLFENNTARDGGAVKWGESDTSLSLGSGDYGNINNCTFADNHLIQDEDACIGLSVYSNYMTITNSTFKDHKTKINTSFEVLYINGDSGRVDNCLFSNNNLTLTSALGLDGNYAVASNNIFINNTVFESGSFAGAIGIQSETADIYNNIFYQNGGDDCLGGSIYINIMEDHQFSFINIYNNTFINTTALKGCVYANGQGCMLDLKISNNTFKSSKANDGAGIYLCNIWEPVTVKNNTFRDITSQNSIIYAQSCIIDIEGNVINNCHYKSVYYTNDEVKGSLKLVFLNTTTAVNKTTTLNAVLYDDMENSILTRDITFKINNKTVNGTKGLNSITTTFKDIGNFTLTGAYDYSKTNVISSNVVVLRNVNIEFGDIVNYGGKVKVEIVLTSDLKPLKDKEIYISYNGNDLLLITDESGMCFTTLDFNIGEYNLTARFVEGKIYESVNKTSKITVFRSINASDMIKAYNSGCDFKATLIKSNGSLLSNTEVVFDVGGIKYKVFTDNNGVAVLNQKFPSGVYSISLTNPDTLEKITNSLIIIDRIIENSDLTIYYTSDAYYTVRIVDDFGNYTSGEVIFKINNKITKAMSNTGGVAFCKITNKPGRYTITAEYMGFKVSNTVIVKALLTAKNISGKKSKKIKFKAKLVNNRGQANKNKKITFKIKGKTYKAKTNRKGIATISLKNLKVGKYTITSKYQKSTIKNTIRIKK